MKPANKSMDYYPETEASPLGGKLSNISPIESENGNLEHTLNSYGYLVEQLYEKLSSVLVSPSPTEDCSGVKEEHCPDVPLCKTIRSFRRMADYQNSRLGDILSRLAL